MRSDFYLDERQRKKRRRFLKIKIFGGLALFFVLIIGAAYLVVYSPLLHIKNISIQYLEVQPPDINRQSLEVEPLLINELKDFFASQSKITSFLGAENILIWDNRKLAEFPKNLEIADLTIEKDYFERQVKINIKERKRFGIWCEINNCFWFDKNGVIFSEAPMVEGNLIYKISDFSGRSLKFGDLALEEKLLANLIKIFDVLEKSDLKIKSLKLENLQLQEVITESTNSLPKIYFSLRIDPSFTLAAIDSMKKIGLEKIEYVDLRVENRAYYKLK